MVRNNGTKAESKHYILMMALVALPVLVIVDEIALFSCLKVSRSGLARI